MYQIQAGHLQDPFPAIVTPDSKVVLIKNRMSASLILDSKLLF